MVTVKTYEEKTEWNVLHQKTNVYLGETNKPIAKRTVKNLLAYFDSEIKSLGLSMTGSVSYSVSKIGTGDSTQYSVELYNDNVSISLNGILLDSKSRPHLDHGFSITRL